MPQWRVIGVDRVNGSGRAIEVEADSRREAMERANDKGVLVERVEPVEAGANRVSKQREDAKPENTEPKQSTDVDNPRNEKTASQPKRKKLVSTLHGLRDATEVHEELRAKREKKRQAKGPDNPFSSEANGLRMSGNRIAEIAAGVFLGMLLMSCVSPCFIYGIITFLAEMGKQNPITP